MAQPFIGQIIPVAFGFVPVGWLACNGSLLPINEYDTLFTLIGTTYGGDGQSNFALPNLNGRVALGAGQGPGLSSRVQGELGGTESVTLNTTQLGGHTHPLMASSKVGTVNTPATNTVLAAVSSSTIEIYAPAVAGVAMAAAITAAGGNQAHENRQPFNTVNYIIAYAGIFPSPS